MLGSSIRRAIRRTLCALVVTSLAVLASMLTGSMSSPATAADANYPPGQKCSLSLAKSLVSAGESVRVLGTGFRPGKTVTITLHAGKAFTLGTTRTTSTGTLVLVSVLPETVPRGRHLVTASQASACTPAAAVVGQSTDGVSVDRNLAGQSVDAGSQGLLRRTGAGIIAVCAVGALAFGAAGGFIASRRRRRTP